MDKCKFLMTSSDCFRSQSASDAPGCVHCWREGLSARPTGPDATKQSQQSQFPLKLTRSAEMKLFEDGTKMANCSSQTQSQVSAPRGKLDKAGVLPPLLGDPVCFFWRDNASNASRSEPANATLASPQPQHRRDGDRCQRTTMGADLFASQDLVDRPGCFRCWRDSSAAQPKQHQRSVQQQQECNKSQAGYNCFQSVKTVDQPGCFQCWREGAGRRNLGLGEEKEKAIAGSSPSPEKAAEPGSLAVENLQNSNLTACDKDDVGYSCFRSRNVSDKPGCLACWKDQESRKSLWQPLPGLVNAARKASDSLEATLEKSSEDLRQPLQMLANAVQPDRKQEPLLSQKGSVTAPLQRLLSAVQPDGKQEPLLSQKGSVTAPLQKLVSAVQPDGKQEPWLSQKGSVTAPLQKLVSTVQPDGKQEPLLSQKGSVTAPLEKMVSAVQPDGKQEPWLSQKGSVTAPFEKMVSTVQPDGKQEPWISQKGSVTAPLQRLASAVKPDGKPPLLSQMGSVTVNEQSQNLQHSQSGQKSESSPVQAALNLGKSQFWQPLREWANSKPSLNPGNSEKGKGKQGQAAVRSPDSKGQQKGKKTFLFSPHYHHNKHIHWSLQKTDGAENLKQCEEKHDVSSLLTPPSTFLTNAQDASSDSAKKRFALPKSLELLSPPEKENKPASSGAPASSGTSNTKPMSSGVTGSATTGSYYTSGSQTASKEQTSAGTKPRSGSPDPASSSPPGKEMSPASTDPPASGAGSSPADSAPESLPSPAGVGSSATASAPQSSPPPASAGSSSPKQSHAKKVDEVVEKTSPTEVKEPPKTVQPASKAAQKDGEAAKSGEPNGASAEKEEDTHKSVELPVASADKDQTPPKSAKTHEGDHHVHGAGHENHETKQESSHGSHDFEQEMGRVLKCRFHRYGCEFVKEAWEHENECEFRQVECPDLKCSEKVCLKDLLDHIKAEHPFALWLGEVTEDYISRQYWNIKSDTNFKNITNTWVLTIWEFDGKYFISVFTRVEMKWYSWVYIVSHMLDARLYEYDIRIRNPDRNSANSYKGIVHPIDESSEAIRKSHNCFVITDDTVKHYMTKKGLPEERIQEGYDYRLPIEYKISRIRDDPMSGRKDEA